MIDSLLAMGKSSRYVFDVSKGRMRVYLYVSFVVLLFLFAGCSPLKQNDEVTVPVVTIKVTDIDGNPIPYARIEEQWLWEDGSHDFIIKRRVESDGTLMYSIGAEDVDATINGPAKYSIQAWVYANGYQPKRQIFQIRKLDTVVEFKLAKK